MQRRWIILIIAGAFILSTLVVGLLIHASFHQDVCPETICKTPECVQAAAQILNYIDTDVDPCDNFYLFACGNFIKTAEIPDDTNEISTNSIINDDLQKQLRMVLEEPIQENEIKPFSLLKTYYQACMNTEAVERRELKTIRELLKEVGGWPVLEDYSWDRKNLDWYYYVYKLRQLGLTTNHILKLDIEYNFRNTTFHMLELDQPSFSLPRGFLIDTFQNEYVKEYLGYMVKVAIYLGANEFRATSELREALKFEMKLAQISLSKEERSNITNFYNIMSIKDLLTEHPTISWLEYINTLISPSIQVTAQERILVLVPDYIKKLEELLQKTSKRDQINYLVWKAVASVVPYLGDDLRKMELKFYNTISGIEQKLPRWKECVQHSYKSFPIALSAKYIRTFFDEEAVWRVQEIVKNIKQGYVDALGKMEWMDKKTKQGALEKAAAMANIIGYPDELAVDKKLEEIYNELDVHPKEYLQSFLNISIMMENLKFKNLRELKVKTAWQSQSYIAEVDAFYSSLTNTMIIPAGILQGAYFNKDRPNYLNYGGIGFAIGHEITHAFDNIGRQFNKDGNLRDWWEPETEAAYLDKVQCYIDQYNDYNVTETDQTVNGVITLGDNIADNGGIKYAYAAYLKWAQDDHNEQMLPGLNYTPLQLFWISFALNRCSKQRPEHLKLQMTISVHSPPEFRVIGALQNLQEFTEDFDCPEESEMYPIDKCEVW